MNEKSRTHNAMLNISFSLLAQFITAFVGLILPQLMIKNYGSETNGLIASILQFLSFITLLEAGAGGVIRSSLYRPLAEKDMDNVSMVYKATQEFFWKIGAVFILYVVALCFIYPSISKTEFEPWYVVLMILVLSIGTVLQYFLGITNYTIIIADQKAYIVHVADIITLIANLGISVVLIKLNTEIHLVKLVSCGIFAIKPFIYAWYVKKNYKLNHNAKANKKVIAQRWNGLVHHIAYFIHTNTDVVLITIFMGAGYVSIYTVYSAVVIGIKKVLMAISDGIVPGIGNLIVKESKEHILYIFERFEFLQTMLVTVLFSTTASMIIPFMQIYTKNITDYDYILPLFGQLIILAEGFYCIRCIFSNFSLAAGRYKETQIGAIAEAGLNFFISLILIQHFGMIGIAVGTVIGMFSRMVFDIIYTSKHILERPIKRAVKNIVVQFTAGFMCVILAHFILPEICNSWFQWILWAMGVFCGNCLGIVVVNFVFFREKLMSSLKWFLKAIRARLGE